jgi:hypothetical protein
VRLRKMGITLVPVLVPVCTGIRCDLVRSDAACHSCQNPMDTGDLRLFATPCEGLQKGKKRTQNPPRTTSWGSAPLPAPLHTFKTNNLQRMKPLSPRGFFRAQNRLVSLLVSLCDKLAIAICRLLLSIYGGAGRCPDELRSENAELMRRSQVLTSGGFGTRSMERCTVRK